MKDGMTLAREKNTNSYNKRKGRKPNLQHKTKNV